MKRRGFTLVELLVVIAIITLLLAVGTPSLRHALEFTGMLTCASNFRQIGLAIQSYTAVNNHRLPGPNWLKGSNQKGWLYEKRQMSKLEHLETGLLWPHVGTYEVFRCPDDDIGDPTQLAHYPNNSRAITSYCMNGSVCAYGRRPYNDSTGFWDTFQWTDFDPNDLVMWEADETTDAKGWWHDGANFPWEGITQRHMDRGNTISADGHAEWILLTEYYRIQKLPVKNRLWNVPNTANGH